MIVDLKARRSMTPSQPPLIPPGSLIEAQGKFWGHEMVAVGRCQHGREFVSHNEPETGHHIEPLDKVSERYVIQRITPPVSQEHAAAVLYRDATLIGTGYSPPLKNCQHDARYAYYGQAHSPTALTISLLLLGGVLLYAGTRDR
jgi:hypothetical protein